MSIVIENIPYISLMWTGLGFTLILIGIFTLAHLDNVQEDYTGMGESKAEELFSFFLEEEEKKNDALRASLLGKKKEIRLSNEQTSQQKIYNEIIKCYEEGIDPDEIAKKLNIGKGEVQLIISLYAMR